MRKILGWILSVIFLIIVIRQLEWNTFLFQVRKLSWTTLIGLIAIYLVGFLVRGLRAQALLGCISFKDALSAVFVGYAANNVFPARAGEFVRAKITSDRTKLPLTTVFSSVLIERIFDGAAIVTLLILATPTYRFPEWVTKLTSAGMLVFISALLIVCFFGWFGKKLTPFFSNKKIGKIILGLIAGAELATRSIGILISITFLSFLIWIIEGSMFLYGFEALHITAPWKAAYFSLGVVNLGVLLPSSPGGVGIFQYFVLKSLEVWGVDSALAASYSIVLHVCQLIPVIIIGFAILGIRPMLKQVEVATHSEENG